MNLYVSNLAYTTTEDALRHLFDAYGTVGSVPVTGEYSIIVTRDAWAVREN
jgi:RNA recognition motif-containing protein